MEDLEQYKFYLSSEHIDVLDKVDTNHSKALRTILSSIGRFEKRKQQKQIFDRTVLISSLGLLFLIFSLSVNSYHLSIQFIGLCVIVYGVIRGIADAIQL